MADRATTNIAVSLATYNRPLGLERVLDGIEMQDVTANVHLRVIVVDNSEDANARAYVEQRAKQYSWPLAYYHEAKRGISFARNTGLQAALLSEDEYIAFIDDDEWPQKQWITELLNVADDTGAAAVFGAIEASFQRTPPWWIISGGFFGTPPFADREPVPYGYTSNALVQLSHIRALDLRFDSRYALTGGEDTLFFKTIRDAGGKSAFAQNALTYEYIVPSRATLTHLVKFWYRTGNTDGIIEIRSRHDRVKSYCTALGRGLSRATIGTAGTIITLPTLAFKRIYPFTYLRIMFRGLGYLTSAFGVTFEEYRDHKR